MEWVHGNGRTVDEAKERALEQLGVAESDAEIEVLSEPKAGLFGRVRGEALVRARVRPMELRPKRQRRQRERPRGEGGAQSSRTSQRRPAGGSTEGPTGRGAAIPRGRESLASGDQDARGGGTRQRRRGGGKGGGGQGERRLDSPTGNGATVPDRAANGGKPSRLEADKEESVVAEGVSLQEQAEVAKEFLEGLLERYGLDANVEIREIDSETVELAAHGEGLGVLVGPKGATLAALQDVTRTVVQRRFPNRTDRILVDVAGYRERRIAALRRFTEELVAEVRANSTEHAMEPMTPADRKVVHDTVASHEGVVSRSEGEEPHRYVVIAPGS